MKTKSTIAILVASTMMLTLMGCGGKDISSDADTEIKSESLNFDDSGSSNDADEAKAELKDDQITYSGNTVSILDDAETTLASLGLYNKDRSILDQGDFKRYDYGKKSADILFDTQEYDEKEYPVEFIIISDKIKTSKGIDINSSESDIIASYGEPTSTETDNYYHMKYDFGDFSILFDLTNDKNDITGITYLNNAIYDRLHSTYNN